ncbi:MAG: hypothetical protein A2233_03385 [Candidatus Kerfeldbacteria bacterium RIFOXYA2_FULL_38_24]|uniref:DUF4386 domain-containing protein n=1 Tax=Candidatus Kerfeldbacteria bacterium RIFOXYB2_FULL_38_14 TaxID=1798547 RepID=A0A1G2B9E9_9BACT|nr:MAG: hypothetical protein A2233_03385 [Candidatus Kerfeldbacteria bacterium RIFOXYA2_FULL_38_24]OGY85635.1 MAG: hypothetical protein A2319_02625 [Candidatus Kerfeldbacteria bacterium RIFOXYB2_FULL_38_14]
MTSKNNILNQETLINKIIRYLAVIGIMPGIILPFYQFFLHGGRDAASIIVRSAAHAEAHVLGGVCSLLLIFPIIATFFTIAKNNYKKGLLFSFVLVLFTQALYGGLLFVDGFTNTILAQYDPVQQTNQHSENLFEVIFQNNLLGMAPIIIIIGFFLLIIAYALWGSYIIRSRIFPKLIGGLFIMGGLIIGTALFTPAKFATLGYAGIGFGNAWLGLLIFTNRYTFKA